MHTFHLDGFGDLPLGRKQAYAFYKMVPLEDGFPGRKTLRGEVVPHPIYGTYLIRDWVTLYRRTKDDTYLENARRVADSTIRRMTSEGDALIFYYEDNGLLNFRGGTFYSGLTQSRYMAPLAGLADITGEQKYAEAARAVFHSLTIPADKGGVMREHGDGAVIEEFPHSAPNYVLNGWTTAILEVFGYAQIAKDDEAWAFGEANMRALRSLLPLYDVPDLANSRYRLSGHMNHRLKGQAPFKIVSGGVRYGDETFPFEIEHGNAKWTNIAREDGENRWLLETVLLRHLYPRINVLDLVIDSTAAQTLDYIPRKVRYDPFSRLPGDGWGERRKFEITKGRQKISITIPWETAPLIGEPTTFSKKVPEADGTIRQRNVYHWLHVSNLWTLYELTQEDELLPWIDKWARYSKRWPEMEIYQHENIDYAPVGSFKVDLELVSALTGEF